MERPRQGLGLPSIGGDVSREADTGLERTGH